MGFRLEVQAYKIDPTDHKNVIFDQGGDLESYHNHQAWDYCLVIFIIQAEKEAMEEVVGSD